MPIKPEYRARYPANWKAIRARIPERAGHCCEQCKVSNGAVAVRGIGDDEGTFQLFDGDGEVYDADTDECTGRRRASGYTAGRMSRIGLTIAHLDHVPENCAPPNLKALCQLHHLKYDAAHHAETARQTRRARKAIDILFSGLYRFAMTTSTAAVSSLSQSAALAFIDQFEIIGENNDSRDPTDDEKLVLREVVLQLFDADVALDVARDLLTHGVPMVVRAITRTDGKQFVRTARATPPR